MTSHVAIVTGGAAGIGRATAEIFLDKNIRVCISDIDVINGEKTGSELQRKYGAQNIFFVHCDVSNLADLRGMFESTVARYGHVDIVVNNAGMMNESKSMATLDVNLRSVIQCCELCMEFMGKPRHSGGVIVNVASMAGVLPITNVPVYTATKHAVVAYTRTMGALLPEFHNIRVNCVCPAYIDTPILNRMAEGIAFPTQDRVQYLKKIMKHMPLLPPRVVGECVWELVDNKSLTGQVYVASIKHPRSALRMPDTETAIYRAYCGDKPKL